MVCMPRLLAILMIAVTMAASRRPSLSSPNGVEVEISRAELLTRQVGLAQQLVSERPDSALQALRQMLNQPEPEAELNAEKAA